MSIFVEENDLIRYYMRHTGVEFVVKMYYGARMCLLNEKQLHALAEWVKLKLREFQGVNK